MSFAVHNWGIGSVSPSTPSKSRIGAGGEDPRKPGRGNPHKGHYDPKNKFRVSSYSAGLKARLDELKQRIPDWQTIITPGTKAENSHMRYKRQANELYAHLTPSRQASFDEKCPPVKKGRPRKPEESNYSYSYEDREHTPEVGLPYQTRSRTVTPPPGTYIGEDGQEYPTVTDTHYLENGGWHIRPSKRRL